MQLTTLLVPTYTQMLKTLSGWLKKAQTQLPEAEAQALLSARLAPDMFPLSTQVRFACVQAREAVCRLRGEAFPAVINGTRKRGQIYFQVASFVAPCHFLRRSPPQGTNLCN